MIEPFDPNDGKIVALVNEIIAPHIARLRKWIIENTEFVKILRKE